MEAILIDGNAVARAIRTEIAQEVDYGTIQGHRKPNLAVILVGADPPSVRYTTNKQNDALETGFDSIKVELPDTISQARLLETIAALNREEVDGILCQLPLPKHIKQSAVMEAIDPAKDVDGFHSTNIAKLFTGNPGFVSCTPLACQELLARYNIPTAGKHVVIIGRSTIVGKPLALLLAQKSNRANATVTLCHSGTKNLPEICRSADILVAAIGQPKFVQADWIKDGAAVIDVGINQVEDKSKKSGYRLVGDVNFEAVLPKVSAITPVPGGVGPMTIAMLLKNTLSSWQQRFKLVPVLKIT